MKPLIQKQYQNKFKDNSVLQELHRPKEGWIRSLRKALGMSSPQLGKLLRISKAQASQMERMEVDDRITLKQLRRVAEALNCELKYALVPRQSIHELIRDRARIKAKKLVQSANQQMLLESQQLDEKSLEEQIEMEMDRLLQTMPRDLWED
jgi:predicted DNA-binding mobile mystery protein A